jgi:hypothetical protein
MCCCEAVIKQVVINTIWARAGARERRKIVTLIEARLFFIALVALDWIFGSDTAAALKSKAMDINYKMWTGIRILST